MSRRERINEAIREIRDFYDLGRQVEPKRHPGESYGQRLAEYDAQKRGTTADNIRKAREFADPDQGYTPKELSELCKLIRRRGSTRSRLPGPSSPFTCSPARPHCQAACPRQRTSGKG